jgi:peptidoglycan/LPS O-acetylase OafA/YrhL
MDQDFSIGSGLSILFGFLRWRIPKMTNHTAEGGILAGVLLILADFLVPDMKPNIFAAGLLVIGLLCVGAAFDVWLNQKKLGQSAAEPAAPIAPNTMGGVVGNTGIITQGQKGDNSQ